jgi:hypothetical protein
MAAGLPLPSGRILLDHDLDWDRSADLIDSKSVTCR